jgi:hypothetical protein
MKLWFLVMLLSASAQVFAGGEEVVSGGNVVLFNAEKDQPGPLWLLDFTEARFNLGWQVEPQTMTEVLAKLFAIHPAKELEIAQFDKDFEKEAYIGADVTINDTTDANPAGIPEGAKVLQAAAQHRPTMPDEPRYLISKKLWEQLDDLDKQGLKTHEIIYRSAIEDGAKNSNGVRALNAALYAKPLEYFQNMTDAERYRISVNVGWSSFLTHSFIAPIDDFVFFYKENGNQKCAGVPRGTKLKLSEPYQDTEAQFSKQDNGKYNRIGYFSSGNIYFLHFVEDLELSSPAGKDIPFSGESIFFHPTGWVQYGKLTTETKLKRSDGSDLLCASEAGGADIVAFDSNGYAVECFYDFPFDEIDVAYRCEF